MTSVARSSLKIISDAVPNLVSEVIKGASAIGLPPPLEAHLFSDLATHAIQKSLRSIADHTEEAVRLSGASAWDSEELEAVFLIFVLKSIVAGGNMIIEVLADNAKKRLEEAGKLPPNE